MTTKTPSTIHRLLQTDQADTFALPHGTTTRITARPGHTYRVVTKAPGAGASGGELADDVIATRHGKALHVSYPDKTEAVFDDFFEACAQDRCSVELPADDKGAPYRLTGGSPQGVASSDNGQVLYAHGDQQTVTALMQGQGVAYDGTSLAGMETAAGHSTYIPPADRAAAWPWAAGGLALGGLGLAAAGGGSGGGSSSAGAGSHDGNGDDTGSSNGGDSTGTGSKSGNDTSVPSSITGNVTGPVIAGHGLKATAYRADGSELATTAVADDGSFSMAIDPAYTGTVLVRVTDTSPGADYRDVAANVDRDLDTDLRAATVVSAPGVHHVNVNVLTEQAVRDLGLAGGDGTSATALNAIDGAQVQAANARVAAAIGLSQDLAGGPAPVAIEAADGTPDAGVNDYGRVLAALAGAEQGTSLASVLNGLAGAVGADGLSPAAIALLIDGAARVDGLDPAFVERISDLTRIDSAGNVVTIDDIAVDDVVNRAEAQAGVVVHGTAAAHASVSVDWAGLTQTVSADAQGHWQATFGPSAAQPVPADGASAIVATQQDGLSAARGVYVDTTGPAAGPAPLSYVDDVGAQQSAASTAPATDDGRPGLNIGAHLTDTPTLYVDGSAVAASYDAAAGTLTPDVALADGQHAFTYSLTDALGNEGAQSAAITFVTFADAAALSPAPAVVAGTAGDDLLTDNGTPSVVVGGAGNDTLTATAISALYGGDGDDTFVIDAAIIDALDTDAGHGGAATALDALARIHGNAGTDTIALDGHGLMLHLPSIFDSVSSPANADPIRSIEIVDLTNDGGGSNMLLLRSADLIAMTDEVSGTHVLRVTSGNGGTVDVCDSGGTTDWTNTGPVTEGSVTYDVWTHVGNDAQLYVQQGITVV